MEKRPSFERIIGGSDEQKNHIIKQAEEASFKTGKELFGEQLVEPTEEEKESIEKACNYANQIAVYYGSLRQFNLDRIFLLRPGGVEKSTEGEVRTGVCNRFEQSIAIDRRTSNALLASCVVHEMFHMDSYSSAQVIESDLDSLTNKTRSKPYRGGISMRSRENDDKYFGLAEEAIIATLSRRFFDEVIVNDPLYKEEIERTRKIKEWLFNFAQKSIPEQERRDKFISNIRDILILPESDMVYRILCESGYKDNYKIGFFIGFFEDNLKLGTIMHERVDEREKFNKVLDRLVTNSKGKISDRNQLFDQFAKAHFTGNYLPLARSIEDSLGKGSFREIAKELGEMSGNNLNK